MRWLLYDNSGGVLSVNITKLKCGGPRLLSHFRQVMCTWQARVSDSNQRSMASDRLLGLCIVFC